MAGSPEKGLDRAKSGAFTLAELLVAMAVVALLAALLFSVFGGAKEGARRTTCLSNLHQLGLALEGYRADWDDRKPIDNILRDRKPLERQAWVSLKPYVKTDGLFLCPEDPRRSSERVGYIYRAFIPDLAHLSFRVPLGTDPSSMSAWCMYHLKREVLGFPGEEFDNPIMGSDGHYEGTFLFLRNDTSASKANAKSVDTYVSDGTGWYVLGKEPPGFDGTIRTERYPGEPWPPEFQW